MSSISSGPKILDTTSHCPSFLTAERGVTTWIGKGPCVKECSITFVISFRDVIKLDGQMTGGQTGMYSKFSGILRQAGGLTSGLLCRRPLIKPPPASRMDPSPPTSTSAGWTCKTFSSILQASGESHLVRDASAMETCIRTLHVAEIIS